MNRPPTELPLIDDSRTLHEVVERLSGADLIALDTEFVRESTYYPQLCLFQIAANDFITAVDCLADIDLDPLFDALFAPGKTWVLHSARQDLEVLFNRAGSLPSRLIDTQVAASLLGLPLQIGLQDLLREKLDTAIGKEHTRADWSRRPLPEAVMSYALDDVRFLLPAWRTLETELEALGRLAWLEEDCARLLRLPILPDTAAIFERTKGAGSLKGAERAAALALVAWRETRARDRDRPRRWILTDEALIRIARAVPGTLAGLEALPGLPPRLIERSGKALLAAIHAAEPVAEIPISEPPDKEQVERLKAEVKARAERLGIQPEVLATRRDIAQAAAGQWPDALAAGWRGSVLAGLAALKSSPGS